MLYIIEKIIKQGKNSEFGNFTNMDIILITLNMLKLMLEYMIAKIKIEKN